MHPQTSARRSAASLLVLLLALALALVAAAAVAAAPAAAAPTPTVLTVAAQRDTVAWGAKGVLNGILQTTVEPILPVDRQEVLVEYATSSAGPWSPAATVTNVAAPYTSGAYTYSWTVVSTYYWRMRFPGTPQWGSSDGDVRLVKVKAAVGRPACPKAVKAGKKFTVSGSLKPRARAGSKTVTVSAQRYLSGKWRAYKAYRATNTDSGSVSTYSLRLKIAAKGKFRFQASTRATSALGAGKSVYSRTLKVR
jgi:hypothetical protein